MSTADLPTTPGPQQDRAAPRILASNDSPTPPANSRKTPVLNLLTKLITYGKAVLATLQQRNNVPHLTDAVQIFGTPDVALIVSIVMRGLRRAILLQARLMRPDILPDRPAAVSVPNQPTTRNPPSPEAVARAQAARAARIAELENPALSRFPTPAQIAIELQYRSLPQVLADISRDFGIMPSHPLWRELRLVTLQLGGNPLGLFRDVIKRAALAEAFVCSYLPIDAVQMWHESLAALGTDPMPGTGPP